MKPSVLVKGLACACLWLSASLGFAEPLITSSAIDWLLDCPFPAVARPDPEVLDRTQCGTVRVPRDHAAPTRGSLRLTLIRVGARQPLNREGVVFIQAGEPQRGQGAAFAVDLASRWESYATPAYRTLANRYDVIELSVRDLTQDNSAEQAARDMDFVRAQLGDAQLNFLGIAQATRLGGRYAALFPERVARMALVNAGSEEPAISGVDLLRLKEVTRPGAVTSGCVNQWVGDFLVFGKQPPVSTRCLDRGAWE
ncbi:alpha/beta fold hydrolase [Pseudomonas tolaasii]|uniref:Alpha/beta fold hydrolase n=2 Tax=Pseudomonas tolaasii TaxID=29442 RepID=A0A7Y8AL34_PSETO|nr:alpha/beta fold hydrolase [Pseudomonas tolaasii]ARB29595.1 proteinase [Pseudomonas tolaasii]KAB0478244.1 alpha/beta hydrolase [Pseudomonas tolaasii]MBY8942889.1 alpha/beta fold hydrolase [Pseudomonas tolaasii]NWC23583.1 alpha/beta fold hydrolase [Pseudomonas tolaasii]NWC38108.1 alpha/beta fold hydrolase [Pseudomonas tolaasii]